MAEESIIQLAQLIIGSISAILIIVGLYFAIKQLSDQHEWYRREKAISYSKLFFPRLLDFQSQIEEEIKNITYDVVIPYEKIEEIIAKNRENKVALNSLLNYYENIAIACNNNIADEEILFQMIGGSLVADYKKFYSYIEVRRKELHNPKLYLNLQTLAENWAKRFPAVDRGKPPLG